MIITENILFLKFKDSKNPLEFDLNKNTVFFGNNGKGKTRILKTINSLHKLDKQKRMGDLSVIIDSMNLEELKIDNVSYNKLISNNEDFRRQDSINIFKFIDKNRTYFFNIFDTFNLFTRYSLNVNYVTEWYFDSSNKFREVFEILDYIVNTDYKRSTRNNHKLLPNKIRYTFHSSDDFLEFLKNMRRTLIHLFKYSERSKSDFFGFDKSTSEHNHQRIEMLELACKLAERLIDNFYIESSSRNDQKIWESMNSIRDQIMSRLSSKSSHYITTDNIDISSLNKVIDLNISNINEDLQFWFWNNSDEQKYKDILQNKNLLDLKVNKFNNVMRKYGKIKIDYIQSKKLTFLKDENPIEFEKLSSGERKISYLFLELIFNDVDIYLIDEPELSVSLNFQNKIITDIHNILQNKIIFIATHAPFIFDDFKNIPGNTAKEVK